MPGNNDTRNRAREASASHGQAFAASYLAAKKSIDDWSLNQRVWQIFQESLAHTARGAPLSILEIGTGIGTMLIRLVEREVLAGRVNYLATDTDPENLHTARLYLSRWAKERDYSLIWMEGKNGLLMSPKAQVSIRLKQASAEHLAGTGGSAASFHLLLAHAVFDLIDFPPLMPNLLQKLTDDGLFYCTCNFDGGTIFLPELIGDSEIIDLYHRSMETRLPGASHTGRKLLNYLQQPELDLLAAGSSDWVIYPRNYTYTSEQAFFLHAIVNMVEGELDKNPDTPSGLRTWARLRHHQIDTGRLSLIARHLDLLARRIRASP